MPIVVSFLKVGGLLRLLIDVVASQAGESSIKFLSFRASTVLYKWRVKRHWMIANKRAFVVLFLIFFVLFQYLLVFSDPLRIPFYQIALWLRSCSRRIQQSCFLRASNLLFFSILIDLKNLCRRSIWQRGFITDRKFFN